MNRFNLQKEVNKSDEALKKKITEYNEMRTSYTALERKEKNGFIISTPIDQFNERKRFY